MSGFRHLVRALLELKIKGRLNWRKTWKPLLNETKEIIFYDIRRTLPNPNLPMLVTVFTIKNLNTQKSLIPLYFSKAAKNLE